MNRLEIIKAAEFLLWSRHCGATPKTLPRDLEPLALEDAYAIQLEATRLRGQPVTGYKIGLTNSAAQQAAGTSAPIVGRLTSNDILRAPALIKLAPQHLRIVEAELVFEIGRTISAANLPFREQTLLENTSAVYAGIELCNSRMSAADLPLSSVVADNSNADLLIVGEELSDWQASLRREIPVVLTHGNGDPVRGSSLRVLGSPLKSVTWLIGWLLSRGEDVPAGTLIASGSCTGMTEIALNDTVTALFDDTAKVTASFNSTQHILEARA